MIVNFFFDNRIGGPHINIFRISKIFKRKIINVTVGKSNFSKINLINLRFHHKFLFFFEVILNIFQIIFLFRKKDCIFISNSIFNIAPIIAGSFLNKKTYWYLLEEPTFFGKLLFKFVNFFFNFNILSISKKICNDLNVKNYKYFPPYIEKKKIKLKKINKGKLKIVSVGNINKVKNHYFAIKSLENYSSEFIYSIVGSKINTQLKLYNFIKNYIKKNFLQKKIKLLGFKNSKDVENILLKNDIFLLPSLTEGCPISLLEALSLGKLCICTKVGDIPLIVKNNKNGFLIDLNSTSFLKTLRKIKNMHPTQIRKIQMAAIKTVSKNFSNKKIYKSIFKKNI